MPRSTVGARLSAHLPPGRVAPLAEAPGVCRAVATSEAEVASVLAEARALGLPVLARAGDLDLTNVRLPEGGGILLDVTGMNRILEVNHEDRYAVVEPGVTWRQLELRLLSEGGDLALPVPSSPDGLTLWSSAVLGGVGGLALAHGALGNRVWGVEALTVTGRRIVTGAAALGAGGWGRGALPDLTGLLLGWRGATAVVTRLSVSLETRHRHQRRLVVPVTPRGGAVAAAVRLSREGLFDEVTVVPWTLPRLLHGVRGQLVRAEGEPEAWLHVDLTADTRAELEYKRLRLHQALGKGARRGARFGEPVALEALIQVSPALAPLTDLPLRLPALPGTERWSFLAAQGPVGGLAAVADQLEAALVAEGLPPNLLVRPVRGGHYGLVHAAVPVSRGPEPVPRILAVQTRGVEALFEAGFVPHRYRPELAERVAGRMDPETRETAQALRALLDPDGLLDPGRWGLTPAV